MSMTNWDKWKETLAAEDFANLLGAYCGEMPMGAACPYCPIKDFCNHTLYDDECTEAVLKWAKGKFRVAIPRNNREAQVARDAKILALCCDCGRMAYFKCHICEGAPYIADCKCGKHYELDEKELPRFRIMWVKEPAPGKPACDIKKEEEAAK